MKNIDRLVKGKTPTLLETVKGNELIDLINSIGNMTINRDGNIEKFECTDKKSTLYLAKLGANAVTTFASENKSIAITINGDITNLKGLTLNGFLAEDVEIVAGDGIQVDVDLVNKKIKISEDLENATFEDIVVCEDGVEKTIRVKTYPIPPPNP